MTLITVQVRLFLFKKLSSLYPVIRDLQFGTSVLKSLEVQVRWNGKQCANYELLKSIWRAAGTLHSGKYYAESVGKNPQTLFNTKILYVRLIITLMPSSIQIFTLRYRIILNL